ncbi:uncharacterized protein PV09_03731 [Verruconis gallopava]|uniref:Uncharacterized protein n=1 Tax=Verruconis gallopava TaxID=253628 RepID=A0A0D2ADW8_9PEZI|nr:uncharacterized protein PV09_03731 [Verruconis gallopava]KIW05183.1 hypothetical protein PV09_03731 [Verruconis gallopava]
MSSSDVEKAKAKSNDALTMLFNSSLDKRITQLVKILSSAAGIDATFCFLGYGAVLTSAQLQIISQYVAKTELKARLLSIALSAKNLGALCSDVRTFLRLWGLLKLYLGAKAAYLTPPKDTILKMISWSQLASMSGYFWYENGVYLAGKGILRGAGFTPAELGPKMRRAIWLYGLYLVLDFVRLYRLTQLASADSRPQTKASSTSLGGEKDVAVVDEAALAKKAADERAWYKSLYVDLSYFPLCFHWGVEGGTIPAQWADLVVGALCSCAGYVSFKEQLINTA